MDELIEGELYVGSIKTPNGIESDVGILKRCSSATLWEYGLLNENGRNVGLYHKYELRPATKFDILRWRIRNG